MLNKFDWEIYININVMKKDMMGKQYSEIYMK